MKGAFEAVKVTERVYWVGAIDWTMRDFHGYETRWGSTYNAYLITGDHVTLIDTVKAPFMEEMLSRIASVVDPTEIRTVISNHAELDHSGCLPEVIRAVHPETVIASANGKKALAEHFHWSQEVRVAGDGERLNLGNAALQFVETRMLHWPDSMFTLLEGDDILFSNDAFGMHIASSERFTDELDPFICKREAAKYYANILLPFSHLVTKLLDKMRSLNLHPRIIAPDHGPIWREQPEQILNYYSEWAAQRPKKKAILLYDTMWGSTARMAQAIGDALLAAGVRVKMLPLGAAHRTDLATEILDAGALLVGSPTMNSQILPTIADAMTYLKGLRPRNLIGAAFGSHGWSGEAVKHLEGMLAEMGVEIAREGLRVKYVPNAEALSACRSFGADVATKLKEKLS
jgi:flavorubredoxin